MPQKKPAFLSVVTYAECKVCRAAPVFEPCEVVIPVEGTALAAINAGIKPVMPPTLAKPPKPAIIWCV